MVEKIGDLCGLIPEVIVFILFQVIFLDILVIKEAVFKGTGSWTRKRRVQPFLTLHPCGASSIKGQSHHDLLSWNPPFNQITHRRMDVEMRAHRIIVVIERSVMPGLSTICLPAPVIVICHHVNPVQIGHKILDFQQCQPVRISA